MLDLLPSGFNLREMVVVRPESFSIHCRQDADKGFHLGQGPALMHPGRLIATLFVEPDEEVGSL
jgi:hypothetical protein